jgi:hypothetical protein
MHSIIQREIEKLEWQNAKGIESSTQKTTTLLVALDLIAFHIERVADALESQRKTNIKL